MHLTFTHDPEINVVIKERAEHCLFLSSFLALIDISHDQLLQVVYIWLERSAANACISLSPMNLKSNSTITTDRNFTGKCMWSELTICLLQVRLSGPKMMRGLHPQKRPLPSCNTAWQRSAILLQCSIKSCVQGVRGVVASAELIGGSGLARLFLAACRRELY